MSQSQNSKTRNRISRASLAGQKRSGFGLAGSVLLHGAIIAATLFTWQHSLEIADLSPPVVPVELVTIADKTNITAVAPEETLKPKEEPLAVTAKIDETVPLPQDAPVPEFKVAEQQKPAPPTPKFKPRPEPKKKFDVNNILALLDKRAPASSSRAQGHTGEQPRRGIGAQNGMTMDLADALRNQIGQCWSPPVGAPHPETLAVTFELFLNPDGSVAQPPQLTADSQAAANANPYMRAAAEAGRRAIYTCEPYKLPADRYSQWRDITLVFDPRKWMGQ